MNLFETYFFELAPMEKFVSEFEQNCKLEIAHKLIPRGEENNQYDKNEIPQLGGSSCVLVRIYTLAG